MGEAESAFARMVWTIVSAYGSGHAETVAEAHRYLDAYEEVTGRHAQTAVLRRIAEGEIDADGLGDLSEDDLAVVRSILGVIELAERPAFVIASAYVWDDPYAQEEAEELLADMESDPGSARLAGVLRRILNGSIEADMLTHLSDGDAAVVRDVFDTIESLRGLGVGRATDDQPGEGNA